MSTQDSQTFDSFKAFYPFYLSEHQNRTSRRLHVIGTTGLLIVALCAILTQHWHLLWLLPVIDTALRGSGIMFLKKIVRQRSSILFTV